MAKPRPNKRLNLASALAEEAEEASVELAARMPTTIQPTKTPTASLASTPATPQIKRIDRINTSLRLPIEVIESMEVMMEGKRRGLWIEHRLSKLFESMEDHEILQIVVDRANLETEVEDKDLGDQMFAVRISSDLVETINSTADRLQCNRSLVLRSWLCVVVNNQEQ